jgi:hypothetical protein
MVTSRDIVSPPGLCDEVVDAFGLAPAGRGHVEAIAALVAGVSLLRHSVAVPGLRSLDARQLTELLTPAVEALLGSAPRHAGHPD